MKIIALLTSFLASLIAWQTVSAEVVERRITDDYTYFKVKNDAWQPDGFENGIPIPATHLLQQSIVLDGKDQEAEWSRAEEVLVPLAHGSVVEASIKALYTDDEIFIRARWPDATENREHHPWTWDAELNGYTSGSQVEDSIFLSFEAGCEWAPSLLQGYVYDFDGWHWLAARSDPVAQAWDMYGTVQDQKVPGLNFEPYPARYSGMDWNVKFLEQDDPSIVHDDWDQLERFYIHDRAGETVYVRLEPDRMRTTNAAMRLAPPAKPPVDNAKTFPQFVAVRLEEDAGEVDAKGHWEDGYWTVEFRRKRVTPANTSTDWVFTRMSQFSIYVFDGVERFDQASESSRLWLRLMPNDHLLVGD